MIEISEYDQATLERRKLRNWLETQPDKISIIIATRAALRNIQSLANIRGKSPDHINYRTFIKTVLLAVFRAVALPWAFVTYPGNDENILPLTAKAAHIAATLMSLDETVDPAISSAVNAADSARYVEPAIYTYADTAKRAAAADSASYACMDDISTATIDTLLIASGKTEVDRYVLAHELIRQRLWLAGEPETVRKNWHALKAALPVDEHWDVWTRWYEDRLEGKPANSELELFRVLQPEKFWKQAPAVINKVIWDKEQEILARQKPPITPPSIENWDFFISYSTRDENLAREVTEVLEQAGRSVYVQFKDFLAGNNFVTEMNRGLKGSSKFIALYSPNYVESEPCEAEWNAAFALDPTGSKRKIIPFMLEATKLPALANQIIYKSLVGLNRAARKKAILEAIQPEKPKANQAQIRTELTKIASPDASLNTSKQLNAGPNTTYDKAVPDESLAELPYILRGLIGTILDSLPGNAPKSVINSLKSYSKHLLERGTQPVMGLIIPYGGAIEKEYGATGKEWEEGLGSLLTSFFEYHELLSTKFPLRDQPILAEIAIDEENATGDTLSKPFDQLNEAVLEAKEANIVTDSFVQLTGALRDFARDLASVVDTNAVNDPASTRATPKRRFVLTTLGFLIRVQGLIQSTPEIKNQAEGAALLAATDKAVEELMKFIL